MMAVSFSVDGETFVPGTPDILFEGAHVFGLAGRNYDISRNGERFLMVKDDEERNDVREVVVVTNWLEELERLVPSD